MQAENGKTWIQVTSMQAENGKTWIQVTSMQAENGKTGYKLLRFILFSFVYILCNILLLQMYNFAFFGSTSQSTFIPHVKKEPPLHDDNNL